MSARASHERARDSRARELASLEARDGRIATARLSLAAAALGILGGIVWGRFGPWAWLGFALDAALFAVLVFVHASVRDAKERVAAALRFHERGLARIAHAWDRLPTGSVRFRAADHPFAVDLDVFGRASLMQLVDATETRGGEEWLARLLSLESPGAWPGDLLDRQKAARDLSERFAFREALAMVGAVLADEKPDAAPLVEWAERTDPLPPIAVWSAWLLPAIAAVALALTILVHASATTITAIVVGQLAIGLAVGRRLAPMVLAVSTSGEAVTRWRAMIALIEREAFDAPRLVRLRDVLGGDATSASRELAALARIVGYADALRNEAFRYFIGPFLMWEAHCARALTRWRARAGRGVRGWLEALAETEALASLGAFAFEHPDFAWPELAPDPMFIAEALGHPLIADDQRVGNDVRLPHKGTALIVTGSNMSGKSTLLRAMGVNAVLAFAGAPACAKALTIGPARVATSMRIEESLEQGVSHFYAELRRLKRVLDGAQEANAAALLFLLDEILHGTNARERVIGALAVLRELIARGALGAVSTHDLGITVLEREMQNAVQNVHFEEQVEGDRMTFDYLLRPGTVQSSNALRLMRALGIRVPEG
jgi:MutS-like protein